MDIQKQLFTALGENISIHNRDRIRDRIRELIAKGANINGIDQFRFTPLTYAVLSKNLEKVRLLIE